MLASEEKHFPNLPSGTKQFLRHNQGQELPVPIQTLNISYFLRSVSLELSMENALIRYP